MSSTRLMGTNPLSQVAANADWSKACSRAASRRKASPAMSTCGDRYRAAASREVATCDKPGPDVTVETPTFPELRAYPSAIATAAASCRALTRRSSPSAASVEKMSMLALPITPKTGASE
jgi:hypothetical protein